MHEPGGVEFQPVGEQHPVRGLWAIPPGAAEGRARGGGRGARRPRLAPENPFPADVAAAAAGRGRPARATASNAMAAALPSLLVQVGGDEVLLDDSVAVVRSAGIAGVRAALEVWPGMQHFFQLGVGVYPEAAEALGAAGTWLAGGLRVPG